MGLAIDEDSRDSTVSYLVVVCVGTVEGGVDDCLEKVEQVKDTLALVELLARTFVVA
jgi:hypothetical protein